MDIHNYEPLFGEWLLTEKLGAGSFGTVYKAVKQNDSAFVCAIKHIPLEDEPLYNPDATVSLFDQDTIRPSDATNSFRRELEINSKLKGYTNIASYDDHTIIERADGSGRDVFIKMELLTPLKNYAQKHTMGLDTILKLGEDICTALTVLERESIVHRDIKPSNILVNSQGDFKLCDFGISKVVGGMTQAATRIGTPDFMSPEQ